MAWRFRQNKTKTGLLSFISMSSILGVGLGCFVLILLLSVMNGFERELKLKVLSRVAHGELIAVDEAGITDWKKQVEHLSQQHGVASVQPRINVVGMIQKGNNNEALTLHGVDRQYLDSYDLALAENAAWEDFESVQSSIILSSKLLKNLGVKIGDTVSVMLPKASSDGGFRPPVTLWFTVAGGLADGMSLNTSMALVQRQYLANKLSITSGAQRLQLRFDDAFQANALIRSIGFGFDQYVYISDWTRTQGHLYNDIKLVRVVIYIALLLLIAVACFNIVSTLFMAVNEKQAAIAVLKTMGTSNAMIRRVFILQGMINGTLGAVVGAGLGTVTAIYLPDLALKYEQLTGSTIIAGDVYFIDFLPSLVIWSDVALTLVTALILCFFATLYPASKAAKLAPARVLAH